MNSRPITFNFESFCRCIAEMRAVYESETTSSAKLYALAFSLKNELNNLFTDANCKEVVLSMNTDKPFFGVRVCPDKDEDKVLEELLSCDNLEKKSTFTKYKIDLDSKLLFEFKLSAADIARFIIQDIDTFLSSSTISNLIAAIDAALEDNGLTVSSVKRFPYTGMSMTTYYYAAYEAIYNMQSVFTKKPEDNIIPNEILKWEKCKLPSEEVLDVIHDWDDAVDIMRTLQDSSIRYNCPTLILSWFFSWAKDYRPQDYYAIKRLAQAKEMEGSELIKRILNRAINDLGVNPKIYRNENILTEAKKGLIAQMKYSGMKSLEDDLYEYTMRMKNIDDENSAILLMRQINSRMGIISDYLDTESENISESELHRWEKLYEKYDKLRDQMVAKPIYSRKMYGLFVDYNALMANSNQNMMTMNTMY